MKRLRTSRTKTSAFAVPHVSRWECAHADDASAAVVAGFASDAVAAAAAASRAT
jgi:hypothetical protein